MGTRKLEIYISADTDKAVKDLQKLDNASENLGDETGKMSGCFSLLDGVMLAAGQAAVGLATNFVKSIPEMVELGVEAKRAELALAGYAGGSAEAAKYTDAVRDAAGGAISEMSAMQNAAKLLSMGLANNAGEAAKLTKMAITLGASMGKGPKQAFEEFTLLLANKSIPRLDTFGISASQVRERMELLADENVNLDSTTRFMMATMEQGQIALEKLDAAGFDATSSLDQLKAIVEDSKVQMAEMLSDGVMPLIDGLIELRETNISNADAALKTSQTFGEYLTAKYDLKDGAVALNATLVEEERAVWELHHAMEIGKDTIDGWAASLLVSADASGEAEEAIKDYKSELDKLASLVDNKVGQAYDRFKDKQEDLTESIGDLEGEIKELEGLDYITPAQLTQIEDANAYIEDQEEWVTKLEDQIEKYNKKPFLTDLQKAELAQAKLDLATVKERIEDAEFGIEDLNELALLSEEQSGQLDKANEKLGEQKEKVKELEEAHDEQTNKMIFNMAAQRAAVDGEVDAMELKLLEGLAGSFNLVDDRQVNATLGIESAFQALAMPGAGLDTALQVILGVAAGVDSIPNYKQIDIVANVSMVGANLAAITGGYLPGYQHGGHFTVGGPSGIDRSLVAFRASRGETVTVTPQGGGGGGRNININFHGPVYADEYELERLILPIVERGIREEQARG